MLPAESEKPVFTWVPLEITSDGKEEEEDDDVDFAHDLGVPAYDRKSGSAMPLEESMPYFGADFASFHLLVCGKKGGGELLDHSIKLMVREDFSGCAPNKCLERLLGPKTASKILGPMLFLRMTKVEDSAYTLDIDPTDFTLALDGLDRLGGSQLTKTQPKKVAGVKVNADLPYYEEVKMLHANAVFTTGKVSALSEELGVPLMTTTCSTDLITEGIPTTEEPIILPTAYLHLSIDPISPAFGTIPATVKNNTASTFVFDANKAATTISAVAALCEFIKDVAEPLLAKTASLITKDRQAAVDSVAVMWKERSAANDEDSDSEESDEEDEEAYFDAGAYDDLADVQAKMGQMQMTTVNARTGMGMV